MIRYARLHGGNCSGVISQGGWKYFPVFTWVIREEIEAALILGIVFGVLQFLAEAASHLLYLAAVLLGISAPARWGSSKTAAAG